MKKYFITTIFTILSFPVFADPIYLNCKLISSSNFNIATAYKNPPTDLKNNFIGNVLSKGLMGYFTPPPTSWEINFSEKTIISPENSNMIFKISKLNNSKLEGNYFHNDFILNRINSKLQYYINIDQKAISEWKKSYGGDLPPLLSYEYACNSASKPEI